MALAAPSVRALALALDGVVGRVAFLVAVALLAFEFAKIRG
ncbi:MAG: hypothetical protein V5A16_00075 [Haloplanus sp.]